MLWSWLKFAILAALIRKCGYERITQQIQFKIILVLLFENPAHARVHVHFQLDKHSTFQEAHPLPQRPWRAQPQRLLDPSGLFNHEFKNIV
jgi:hypothetical protein